MNTSTVKQICKHALWIAALALQGAGARADDAELPWSTTEAASVTINARDLRIERTDDARTLYGRIVDAATRVCRIRGIRPPQMLTGTELRHQSDCVAQAVAQAIAQVDAAIGIDLRAAVDLRDDRLANVR